MRAAGVPIWLLFLSCLLVACGYKTSPRPATATIPAEIALVHAHAYPERIILRWDVPKRNVDGSVLKDISGFKVYKKIERIGEECEDCPEQKAMPINIDFQNPVNATIGEDEVVFTDKDVNLGHTYTYSVTVYNLTGREGRPSEDVVVVFGDPPPAPEALRATVEEKGVRLEWIPPGRLAGLRSYSIYRGASRDVDTMQSVGRTKWAETYFVDESVEPKKTYFYVVRSIKMNRGVALESDPSSIVEVFVPSRRVKPPENVAVASAPGGIRILWDAVSLEDSILEYNVYRSEAGGMFTRLNDNPLPDPGFLDKNVRRGYTYRYAVTAFPKGNPEEESSKSASEALKYTR